MAGETCTAKDGTEIVNLFQGCASGFSPVMVVVEVSENQGWSSSQPSRVSVVRKTSLAGIGIAEKQLVLFSRAVGRRSFPRGVVYLDSANRDRHKAASSWRARNRWPGQERCEADSAVFLKRTKARCRRQQIGRLWLMRRATHFLDLPGCGVGFPRCGRDE